MKGTYITGSSGFVGNRLCARLGDVVKVSHNDIQTTDFGEASRVFFLSAYGNMSTHTDESAIVKANVLDLAHVLSIVNWRSIESFVFMSTSSVKLRVQTVYSRTKRAAEEMLLAYMERFGAPITIVRPTSITGVGEQPAHLIPTLIRSCLRGEHMNFVENPAHDFIDVIDVCEGIVSLSNNKARGIFELGTGKSYTNKEVLNIVEKMTKKKANITVVPSMREYDTEDWVSTNFKSRGWGWIPEISLKDSIYNMVQEAKNVK